MYCELKAVGGWALYCNTMRSQDTTRRWRAGGARGAGHARGAQVSDLGAPRHASWAGYALGAPDSVFDPVFGLSTIPESLFGHCS